MPIAVFGTRVSCISANNLAFALKCDFYQANKDPERDFGKYTHVFNYGSTEPIIANKIFNKKENIEIAIDKISTFKALAKHNFCVEFTDNKEQAEEWLSNGYALVCRALSQGCNGKGIVYTRNKDTFINTPAKFWTKYLWHTNEFRVHVWQGKVVNIFNKVETPCTEPEKEGRFEWNFDLFEGAEDNPQLVNMCNKVYETIGLDWCGIDILRTEEGRLHILEVNSAPHLQDVTATKLAKLIRKACRDDNKHL